jgi:hypothetical protein
VVRLVLQDFEGGRGVDKSPRYPLDRRLGGLQSQCESSDEGLESWFCGFGCSPSGVDEDSGILVCYVMPTGKLSATFRYTVSSSILHLHDLG